MTARLRETYDNQVFNALKEKFQYKNVMEVPKLVKITINMGLGEAKDNAKIIESAVEEIALISGQRPVVTKARKSIANFKVRQGMPVGAKVTLRGDNMYVFADKFFNIALPRVRDFKGVSKNSFDGRGNYSMGIKEQLIFPEINYDKVETIKGMNIVFTTTAKTDEEAAALLELLGMPFEKEEGIMAKTSLKGKQARKPKYSTRAYTRCRLCGRPHSVLRKYGICRICFRELAYKGEIPGVRKASW